jgi:deoxycytidylate deaminase
VRTIHAEINAIAQAATSGTSIEGSTAYVTAMPCYDCAKALINAGIKTVVYGEFYASRYGKSDDVVAFLTEAKVNVKHIVPRPVNPVPRVLHMPRNELAGAIEVGATAGCVVVVTEPDGSKTVVDALGDAA